MSSNQPSASNISIRQESSTPTFVDMLRSDLLNKEGIECMNAAKFNEAFEKFDQSISLYPSHLNYCNRAAVYGVLHQHIDVINDCRAAIQLDPNYVNAYSLMGLSFTYLSRYNEAIEAYKKAVELDPKNEENKGRLANVEENLKAVQPDSITQHPEVMAKSYAFKEKGNEYMKASKFNEAIEEYTQAIDLKRDPIFLCNRAAAYCRLKNYKNALSDCNNAIILDSNYAKAYGRLGFIESCRGFYGWAVANYQSALNLDPTNENYKENLALAKAKARETNQGS